MRTCVQVRAERSETTTHSVARRARPEAESILHDPPIQKKRLLALFSHLRHLIPANFLITYFSVSCWMRTCVQVRAERSETTTHSVARRARPEAESILHDPPIQKKRLLALFSHLRHLIPANFLITYFSVSCWMRTCVQVRAERSETTTHSVARRARPEAESILHDPPIQKKRLLTLFSHLRPDNLYKPHHVRPAPEDNHAPAPPIEKALQAAPLGYPGVAERIIRPPASPRRQSRYPAW